MRERRLRRARIATLATLSMTVLAGVVMPGAGLLREPSAVRAALGAAAVLAFAAAQAGVLYAAVTPALSGKTHRRLIVAFAIATLASIPLAGPAGAGRWETWGWIGASVFATAPLLAGRAVAVAVMAAAVAVSAGVGWWLGGPVHEYVLVTSLSGIATVLVSGLHVWLWNLLLEAEDGRAAQARLAAAEERLRFARDVHDLLGHDLSVIALKAELAERAPERAAQEVADLRRLAAAALTDLRQTVHGYRQVDLRAQLTAVERVLSSSGVRCTTSQPRGELPQEVAAQLAHVLREASTNVLRHSRAGWCRIEISRDDDEVRMTVTNDGATAAGPDRHSSGLRGMAERLTGAGGTLRTSLDDGVFTLEVTL
ncbi:sensor histidine kinase [Streptosporangium sp. NPDC003464]